jgi:peptidylprolyl isomerase
MPRLPSLLVLATLLAACESAPPEAAEITNAPTAIATATFAPDLGIDLAHSEHSAAGLYWRDLVVGEGAVVEKGQQIDVYYDGHLPDGSRFEQTPLGRPFTFRVGVGQVIAGWDQGIVGMRVGGKRQLIIPPTLGYGPAASGPIPANATLIFDVEVLASH